MDVNTFFAEFKKYIEYLNNERVFVGVEDIDLLEDGTYTFQFNVAIYLLAKYNLLKILPEHRTGRE